MTELSTKTSTDDSRIGSHSAESPTMTTSCEVASEPKREWGEVGAQLRVSIDHSSCPTWPLVIRVTTSVHVRAARSRSVQYGLSRQACNEQSRCSPSPISRRSFQCMSRQEA